MVDAVDYKWSPLLTVVNHSATLPIGVVLLSTPICQTMHGVSLSLPTRTRWHPTVLKPRDTSDNVLGFTRHLMDGVDGKMRSKGSEASKGLPKVYKPQSYFLAVICTYYRMVKAIWFGDVPLAAATSSATLRSGNVIAHTQDHWLHHLFWDCLSL